LKAFDVTKATYIFIPGDFRRVAGVSKRVKFLAMMYVTHAVSEVAKKKRLNI
jgi:hypothetical protein